ncbi:MAG: acyl-CoA dehydrogenase family protein [Thermoleophilia bacterium]|nr:acyl-CoA dehydrogenase family protein [Thermoleophilia bacterium]
MAAIDVASFGDYLEGDYGEIRQGVREQLARPELEAVDPEISSADYRQRVFEWSRLLADEGQTTLGLPSAYGGGGNIGGSIAAFETLAFGDLSLLVETGVQYGLWGGAILHLGTERHHEEYLADIASLELPGCFAMSESGHGSDVQAVGTTATFDLQTEEWVIDTPTEADRKDWIGNAAVHGQAAAVFAQLIVGGTNHGVHAFVVPIRSKRGKPLDGVRIEDCGHKLGLNGVDNGRLYFDSVRVPRLNLLDRYGSVSEAGVYSSPIKSATGRFFTMVGTLVQGRVSVGGGGISVAKVALTTAVRHGNLRRQFGPPGEGEEVPLLDYRAHQRRLLPLVARTYALHFKQEDLVKELDAVFSGAETEEHARRALETSAAGVKAFATWHAIECLQTGREACGGLGYLSSTGFAARKADAEIFATFEGDNTVLLQLVAKSLLTGYREEFGDLNPIGMAGFIASQVIERFIERTAARELWGRIWDEITPDSEEDGDLNHREYQLALFAWREDHVLSSAARRLKGGIDEGYDPFTVFNACQDHVLVAARTHIDTQILEAFARGVDSCEDENNRRVLDRVCDLYAISTIEKHRGWYQEHGRISSTRSKAVIRNVNTLCDELRPHAGDLVDAWRVPDCVLPEFGPDGIIG